MYQQRTEVILREFKRRYNNGRYGTFGAIDYAIRQLNRILVTERLYQHSIIKNDRNKTAIYTGLCNRSSNNTTSNKKTRDRGDISKRGVRVRTAEKAIRGFFNTEGHEDYALAFSISTRRHEACLFVRKIDEQYHIIHYNPTFTRHVTIFGELLDALNIEHATYGYRDKKDNALGECTFLAWSEMINLVLENSENPFNKRMYWVYSKTPKKFVSVMKEGNGR